MSTYFLTSATHDRRRVFQVHNNAELLIDTLQHYKAQGHYLLHAFVVMPDHIHLLLTPQAKSVEQVVQLIKGGFSHRLGSKLPIWQRSFTESSVRTRESFISHLKYIHENPVRAKLSASPELYRYSSAFRE